MAGYSAYPRHYDYKRLREITNKIDCLLMADIAHISGLVATQNAPNPFDYADIVTTTTHKTLRGPRGAIIFAKKDVGGRNLIDEIEKHVFPGFFGGPHNHQIGAIALALKLAKTPEFKEYQN